jgi:hypothetical protein
MHHNQHSAKVKYKNEEKEHEQKQITIKPAKEFLRKRNTFL